MQVIPINLTQSKQGSFQSCFRIYPAKSVKNLNIFGRDEIRASTNIFREDLDWFGLVQYMEKHFKNKERVNTYSIACSDGSEAYTFAISVFENLPENIQSKFLPVKACDVDEEVLNAAQSGRINLYAIEFVIPERAYNRSINKYFYNPSVSVMIKGDDISETDTISSYQPVQKLKDSVKFKHSDILTELNNLKDSGNSVVMCRNVFPYLNSKYTDLIINSARQNLKQGSLFIIGDYDENVNIRQKLLANGFVQPLLDSKFGNGANNVFLRS